jgi:hypothetical protein
VVGDRGLLSGDRVLNVNRALSVEEITLRQNEGLAPVTGVDFRLNPGHREHSLRMGIMSSIGPRSRLGRTVRAAIGINSRNQLGLLEKSITRPQKMTTMIHCLQKYVGEVKKLAGDTRTKEGDTKMKQDEAMMKQGGVTTKQGGTMMKEGGAMMKAGGVTMKAGGAMTMEGGAQTRSLMITIVSNKHPLRAVVIMTLGMRNRERSGSKIHDLYPRIFAVLHLAAGIQVPSDLLFDNPHLNNDLRLSPHTPNHNLDLLPKFSLRVLRQLLQLRVLPCPMGNLHNNLSNVNRWQ